MDITDISKEKIYLEALSDENLIKLSVGVGSGQITNYGDYNLAISEHPPIQGGLFDYKVFGCIRKCYCGRNTIPGTVCPACGARVVTMEEASERHGYYVMNYPFVSKLKVLRFIEELIEFHPMFERLYKNAQNRSVKSSLKNLVANLYRFKLNYLPISESDPPEESDLIVEDTNGQYKVELEVYSDQSLDTNISDYGPAAFKKLYTKYKLPPSNTKQMEFISKYVNQVLIIPPITSRPAVVKQDASGKWVVNAHIMNTHYRAVIAADMAFDRALNSLGTLADKLMLYYSLNKMVDILQDQFSIVATSKQNKVRNKFVLMVKRTGRTNIVGKPDLPVDTIMIPRSMAYESLKNVIINELRLRNVKDPIDEYENPTEETIKILEEVVSRSCVLFLRNPTISRTNLTAMKVKLWDEIVIGMPLLATHLFGADFDGDQMAYFFITSPDMVKIAMEKMGVNKNWEFEKNNEPIFIPDASILQGLYAATKRTKYDSPKQYFSTKQELFDAYEKDYSVKVDELVDVLGVETTYGREKIADLLGERLGGLSNIIGDSPINSKNVVKIMKLLNDNKNRVDILRQIQDLALEVITYEGYSTVSIEDIYQTDPSFPEIEEILKSDLEESVKYRKLTELMPDIIMKQLKNDVKSRNVLDILEGSGKLKKSSLVSLFGPRIEYTPERGCIVYDQSIAQGFDEGAHVSHAIENREILIVKQELVPQSGYLTRQLVSINYDILFTEAPSQSKVGAVLKNKHAIGRTKFDGTKVLESDPPEELVRVKSCIDGEADRISREEISDAQYSMNQYKEGDAIGISFATSVTEFLTQEALGLKHGGALTVPSSDKLISLTAGKVTKITPNFITVTSGDKEYNYPVPEKIIYSEHTKGEEFPENTILGYADEMVRAEYKLEALFKLMNSYSDTEKVKKRQIKSLVVYAPVDGVITYNISDNPKKSFVSIGGVKLPYRNDVIYVYPDGYSVKKMDRISSGVLDIKKFHELSGKDYGWTFYAFKKQIEDLLKSDKINSELYEAIFKSLIRGDFSLKHSHRNIGKLLNEINLSYAKQGITKYLGKEIGTGLLTKLMLQDL